MRDGRSVQKTLLYLGEIKDGQKAGWSKAIEVVEGKENRQMSLFPEDRVESHIFVSFLAYCMHVTLRQLARTYSSGLSPRSILEQLKVIQMIDVHVPTTDGRELRMSRYTKPDKTQQLLLERLNFKLPPQPPPEISMGSNTTVVKTF